MKRPLLILSTLLSISMLAGVAISLDLYTTGFGALLDQKTALNSDNPSPFGATNFGALAIASLGLIFVALRIRRPRSAHVLS